jgi:hypothetical protein
MPSSEETYEGNSEDRMLSVPEAKGEVQKILRYAKQKGVVLKLLGGWAVHIHCSEHEFCDREHGDFDFVGLSSQYAEIVRIMKELEFIENKNMTLSTSGSRLLFEKPNSPEHIDVFLDFVDIEHRVILKDRLEIEEDTLSVSDLLLMKLTITRLNEKDVRDIVTIIKDREIGTDDSPGKINVNYIANLCAKKWGLHHDVLAALQNTLILLSRYSFPENIELVVREKIELLIHAIVEKPKSVRWRLRAILGKRIPWKREIDTKIIAVDTE